MSTTLYYNEVLFLNCETLAFNQEVVYDPSHTDKMYSRFRIRVASTMVRGVNDETSQIIPEKSHIIPPPKDLQSMGHRIQSLYYRLTEPRKDFWFEMPCQELVGGIAAPSVIVGSGDPRGTIEWPSPHSQQVYDWNSVQVLRESILDVEHGPKPSVINITNVVSGSAVRVEFEITICRELHLNDQFQSDQFPWTVPPDSTIDPAIQNAIGAGPDGISSTRVVPVLSNRWKMSETRGADWSVERSVSGQLRVKHQAYYAHAMRYLCLPGLQKGFQRIRTMFMDDATGLTLNYDIIDKQREAAPPKPAIDWSGTHSEQYGTGGVGAVRAVVQIKLIGEPGVDKTQLIAQALNVVRQRLPAIGVAKNAAAEQNIITNNLSVVNVLTEPTIELRLEATLTPKDEDQMHLFTRIKEVARRLDDPEQAEKIGNDYRVNSWPIPRPFLDSTPVGLFSCYLQNPYSVWHGIPRPYGYQPEAVLETISTKRPNPESDTSPYPSDGEGGTGGRTGEDIVGDGGHYTLTSELIPEMDSNVSYDSEELTEKQVTFFFVRNAYSRATGRIGLPKAEIPTPGETTTVISQLHSGVIHRELYIEASRIGAPPWLVEPTEEITDMNGITEYLVSSHVEFANPEITVDRAIREYKATQKLVYVLSRYPDVTEKLRIATSPMDKLTPANAAWTPDHYQKTTKIEYRG